MTILTISSNNLNLSYVIQKNPLTIMENKQPFTKSIRKGVVYGWYTNQDNTEFRLWFKDNDSFPSFKKTEFEYLDCSRYGNPYIPIAIINECLKTAEQYFNEYVVLNGMEGVVVKPILDSSTTYFSVPEYMKVRNEDYLKLIYGYDYILKYDRFVREKNISNKVKVSIDESNLSRKLLTDTEDNRIETIVKLISKLKYEKTLDPRL